MENCSRQKPRASQGSVWYGAHRFLCGAASPEGRITVPACACRVGHCGLKLRPRALGRDLPPSVVSTLTNMRRSSQLAEAKNRCVRSLHPCRPSACCCRGSWGYSCRDKPARAPQASVPEGTTH